MSQAVNCEAVPQQEYVEKKFKTVDEFKVWYENRKKAQQEGSMVETVHRIGIEETHYGIEWVDDKPHHTDQKYLLSTIKDTVYQIDDWKNFINTKGLLVSPQISLAMKEEIKKLSKIQKAKEKLYMYLFLGE